MKHFYEVTCSFFRKGTFLYFEKWSDILKYMDRSACFDYTIKGIDELPADAVKDELKNWGIETYWYRDINKD